MDKKSLPDTGSSTRLEDTLVKAIISHLRKCDPLGDFGHKAKSLWEEFCFHINGETSFHELYIEQICDRIKPFFDELRTQDKIALWLLTENGENAKLHADGTSLAKLAAEATSAALAHHFSRRLLISEAINNPPKSIRDLFGY